MLLGPGSCGDAFDTKSRSHPQDPWDDSIFTYSWHIFMVNVGGNISYMDPMGYNIVIDNFQHTQQRHGSQMIGA